MKKTMIWPQCLLWLFFGCTSFVSPMESMESMKIDDAAQKLIKKLTEAHSKQDAWNGGNQKYYIAAFKITKTIASISTVENNNQALNDDFIANFQHSMYDSYRNLLRRDIFFTPEEIQAKAKELEPKIGEKAYELQHWAVAKALGANYIIMGSLRSTGFGLLAEAKLKDFQGNVIAEKKVSFVL